MKKNQAIDKSAKNYADCKFEDYSGATRWSVTHPRHKEALRVAAPDYASAIYAAADRWGERPQGYSFYAYCDAYKA